MNLFNDLLNGETAQANSLPVFDDQAKGCFPIIGIPFALHSSDKMYASCIVWVFSKHVIEGNRIASGGQASTAIGNPVIRIIERGSLKGLKFGVAQGDEITQYINFPTARRCFPLVPVASKFNGRNKFNASFLG
jgi:hypothetical protein